MGWLDDVDSWVVEQTQTLRGAPFDGLFAALSGLPLRLVLLAALLGLGAWLVRTPRRIAAMCLSVGVALAVNGGLTYALKVAVDRPRPFASDPAIVPLGNLPDDPSMPSGHASAAFAAAAALAVFLPRWRFVPFLVALAIGFSRIWLGVHYPTDVLAGALLGAAVGYLCARLVASRLGDGPDVRAVDLDGGPADVRRGGREQEGGDAPDLGGLAVPPERDRPLHRRALVGDRRA
jgi:membrane-associated phospholipid phosphatase